MSLRKKKSSGFSYEVVTSNGCGVHASFDRLPEAKVALSRIAHAWSLPGSTFEIQRVRHLGHAFQYDMRRRSRWVPWDAKVGPEIREPDWMVESGSSAPPPGPQRQEA